ncbi:MAG TPA: TAT-variant-translocated molybdopterin oxidoreductase, partial [Fibrobacteria bacterium]|nr:TAT-variant-translocated molybdopterin oxidoreductase [Fibrobacteria bacterium]
MSSLNLDPKQSGKQYWKSLDELAEAPEFKDFLHREFPEGASELGNGVSRRQFLQVMGAGMALAGVTGCKVIRRPEVEILPYNKMPESLIPGLPQFYATVMSLKGEAVGLLVESHEGRPTKIEGNPKHPASQGATGKHQQAAILDLYNPDRSQMPRKAGAPSDLTTFWAEAGALFGNYRKNGGQGLRFLSGYLSSPTVADLKAQVLQAFPNARWTTYEAAPRDNALQGIAAVTGTALDPQYDFASAKRILSIDSDFCETEPNHIAVAKAFAKTRNPDQGPEAMSRLYQVESAFSPTGAAADHRLRVKPSQVPAVLILAAKELAAQGISLGEFSTEVTALTADAAAAGVDPSWIREMCADLKANAGSSLILVGQYQPALVHALAHVLNTALGNVGKTITYRPSVVHSLNAVGGVLPPSHEGLSELAKAIDAGQVETLVVLDANPAFTAPGDLAFADKLTKVKNLLHLGHALDETALLAAWHVPLHHFLEDWTDALAFDGTASIGQPLIAPMYQTVGASEALAGILGLELRKSNDLVRAYWRKKNPGTDANWRRWLHDGVIAGTAQAPVSAGSSKTGWAAIAQAYAALPKAAGKEILFREHPNVLDGRFADNAWLQELPEPVSKLTWDNAAHVGPKLAKELGLANLLNEAGTGTTLGDYKKRPMVRLTVNGKTIEVVAWVMPGLADDTILLHFGYGRREAGKVGKGAGVDAYALMAGGSPFLGSAQIERTGGLYPVACTQDHWSIEGRPIVRELGVEDYLHDKEKSFSEDKWNHHPDEKALWTQGPAIKGGAIGTYDFSKGMQWGMVIDMNACTGCNTCLSACMAENNVPVVGKEQVMRGREMHWIRLDRYFSGEVENPEMVFQVMTCQQCENAPCEEVCPVAATVHSHEGLNDMAYNRCVGTRYCSNNCPYKVRRFNFFNYTNRWKNSPEQLQKNPDVTVRFRGVMEKCTYCVQRINQARIQMKNKGEEIIPDGMVTPACAQACPTDAIVFGNINDPSSKVAMLKAHP